MNSQAKRGNALIEAVRTVLAFLIVVIHCSPDFYQNGPIVPWFCRLAIPMFFVISGYFLEGRIVRRGRREAFTSCLRRLPMIFIFWCAFYDVWLLATNDDIHRLLGEHGVLKTLYWHHLDYVNGGSAALANFVLTGTRAHLWFLVSVLCTAGIICGIGSHRRRILWPLGIAFYSLTLMTWTYSASPIGLKTDLIFRNGPFYAVLFMVLGARLFHARFSRMATGLLLGIGIAGSLIELDVLNRWGTPLDGQNPMIATAFLCAGLVLLCQRFPKVLDGSWVSLWGKYTLGIYLLHPAVMDAYVWMFRDPPGLVREVEPFVVFGVSLIVVAAYGLVRDRWKTFSYFHAPQRQQTFRTMHQRVLNKF